MKDTNYFQDLQLTLEHSGKIANYLFVLVKKSSFKRIKSDPRVQFSKAMIIRLLIVLKLFSIPSIHSLLHSELKSIIPFGKDLLYKVLNNPWINWRKYLLRQAFECTKKLEIDLTAKSPDQLPCFIVDDSDLPKTGKRMELIGKLYSHVIHRFLLGYKSLNLCYWTGKNLLHLDFSLHGEKGKNNNQGITANQTNNRFLKCRPDKSPGYKRTVEYFNKKTDMVIKMLRRAIRKGFKARYILADSWFFNKNLVSFAIKNKVGLISRPKFNNWRYFYKDKAYTLAELRKKFRYHKSKMWSKKFRLHHVKVSVEFQNFPIQIFFFKSKKRGSKWQAIATTDLKMGAIRAYQIYQNRWSIEVSYKELKQHLGLGKCHSRDFDAQIADTTQCLLAYNYLSHFKTIEQHQTIGGIFKEISSKWLSPTLMQKFWLQLFELLSEIAEMFDLDILSLLHQYFSNNQFNKKFRSLRLIFTTET
jgi:hypothetical protein